ncbi:hypothetical protein Scel_43500 [Streptomyces cellostaticus]|nr:hypothetical protein Scel_43500 [Streptomyces cellostaticus]
MLLHRRLLSNAGPTCHRFWDHRKRKSPLPPARRRVRRQPAAMPPLFNDTLNKAKPSGIPFDPYGAG